CLAVRLSGDFFENWCLAVRLSDILDLENEAAITVTSNEEYDTSEHPMQVDFSHLESIRGSHIFTKPVNNKMIRRQQWGKGFGMLKKALNLAIIANRSEEPYEIHEKFIKEIEEELENEKNLIVRNNGPQEFAQTVKNPIGVKTKGRKGKRIKAFNDTTNILNGEKRKEPTSDMEDKSSTNRKKCGVCGLRGHNVRTCPNLVESEVESIHNTEASTSKRKCGTCGLEGHNA
ncbi:11142_t:CDS:2, partial [Gigaspora rosea]